MLATMQRATVAESQVFHETTSPLLCSSVDFLGFTNSFVEMLEDEIQAKVSLFFLAPPPGFSLSPLLRIGFLLETIGGNGV